VPVQTTILAVTLREIELHLAAAGADPAALEAALDRASNCSAAPLSHAIFSVDGRALEQVVGDLLRNRGLRIAGAESCTGGLFLGV